MQLRSILLERGVGFCPEMLPQPLPDMIRQRSISATTSSKCTLSR